MNTYHIELSHCDRGQGPFWLVCDDTPEAAIKWLADNQERPVTDFIIHPPKGTTK